MKIEIYTDGSCHTQHRVGAWAAIVLTHTAKKVLSGIVFDTTHNRMELTAVIKAIDYAVTNYSNRADIKICTDSQYIIDLPDRQEKLITADFITKKKIELQNTDLIKQLLSYTSTYKIEFIKIKAHQKKMGANNYNVEVDLLSRKIMRNTVREKYI